jgi:hypothetical protein
LALPRVGETGTVHVDAVVSDLPRELGGDGLTPEAARLFQSRHRKADGNRPRVALLACWLLHDDWFRAPVIFRAAGGRAINNIDVTAALKDLALPHYSLRQFAAGTLRLRVAGPLIQENVLRAAMLGVFGAALPLVVEPFDPAAERKVVQYSTDL